MMTVDSQSCPMCSLISGGLLPWGKEPAGQSPIPTTEVHRRAGRFRLAGPGFCLRATVQMLMRSCVVVPATKRRELGAQVVAIGDRDAIELLLRVPKGRSIRLFCHGRCGWMRPSIPSAACIVVEMKQASLSTRIRRGMPYRERQSVLLNCSA